LDLTTISHLRLLSSDDEIHFMEDPAYPGLFGDGALERFGIEDCRVPRLEKPTIFLLLPYLIVG
jgi:beta-1,2-mannobiose phosphorylase / 1,2-beta-oligomannan phosphorylase